MGDTDYHPIIACKMRRKKVKALKSSYSSPEVRKESEKKCFILILRDEILYMWDHSLFSR